MTAVAFDDQVPLYRLHPEMGHPIDTIIDGPLAPPNIRKPDMNLLPSEGVLSDVDERQHLLCWLLDCNLEVPAFKAVVFFLGSLEPFGMEELPFSQDGSSDNGWMATVIGAFAET